MFTIGTRLKAISTAHRIVLTTTSVASVSLLSFGNAAIAQQTPPPPVGFSLGFYQFEQNTPRTCTPANGELRIEGSALLEDQGNPTGQRSDVKLDVTFKNGDVKVKDKSDILRTNQSQVYGPFYYLSSRLVGPLKVTWKFKKGNGDDDIKGENTLINVNLDSFTPIVDDPLPNQDPATFTLPEYVDFAIPCSGV
jgi:hypothetical protein